VAVEGFCCLGEDSNGHGFIGGEYSGPDSLAPDFKGGGDGRVNVPIEGCSYGVRDGMDTRSGG
jgi:hypothetical protein